MQRGRKQLQAQRSCGSDRFVEVTLRPYQQFVRTGSSLFFAGHVPLEVQDRADEQLLETVVERLGELFARVLLSQRQVGRQPAQLSRPLFQFDRAFQLALRVTARLQRLLGPPARGDVEIEPGQTSHVAVGCAVSASQALYPRHLSVWQDNAKRVVPRILPRRIEDLADEAECLRAILFVHTRHPAVVCRRLVRAEAVSRTKASITIDVIGTGLPRPGASGRRVERETQPLFALAQRSLRAGALDRVPGPFGDLSDQRDLCRRPRACGRVVGAEGGHQLPLFQQHHADKRRDLSRPHDDPLGFREPRIRINVAHDHGLAAPEGIAKRRPKARRRLVRQAVQRRTRTHAE